MIITDILGRPSPGCDHATSHATRTPPERKLSYQFYLHDLNYVGKPSGTKTELRIFRNKITEKCLSVYIT